MLIQEFGRVELECVGNLLKINETEVFFAAFNLTDIGSMDTGLKSQGLLRQSLFFSQQTDSFTDCFINFSQWSPPREQNNCRCLLPIGRLPKGSNCNIFMITCVDKRNAYGQTTRGARHA